MQPLLAKEEGSVERPNPSEAPGKTVDSQLDGPPVVENTTVMRTRSVEAAIGRALSGSNASEEERARKGKEVLKALLSADADDLARRSLRPTNEVNLEHALEVIERRFTDGGERLDDGSAVARARVALSGDVNVKGLVEGGRLTDVGSTPLGFDVQEALEGYVERAVLPDVIDSHKRAPLNYKVAEAKNTAALVLFPHTSGRPEGLAQRGDDYFNALLGVSARMSKQVSTSVGELPRDLREKMDAACDALLDAAVASANGRSIPEEAVRALVEARTVIRGGADCVGLAGRDGEPINAVGRTELGKAVIDMAMRQVHENDAAKKVTKSGPDLGDPVF